jgi:hypothetical protein
VLYQICAQILARSTKFLKTFLDDGHIKQYIALITENRSRYIRMGYNPSLPNPDIININIVILSQNSDPVNINRILAEMYNLA